MRSASPSDSKSGVSPLVAEVILVAICVLMSGVILIAAGSIAPDSTPAPQMAFSKIEKEPDQIKLEFAGTIPGTEFIQFKLVVFSPGSMDSMEAIFTGATSYHLNETITLYLIDLGGDGDISSGDCLYMQSSCPLECGGWNIHMVYLSDGSVTTSASVVI
jgi:FlaG/FlaF family flagellin (archaellin)